MARGRKHTAIEVQEATGNFKNNPSRRPTIIINGDPMAPEMPQCVKDEALASAVWNHVTDVLKDAGILSRTDTHLLTHYTITYSMWLKVQEHVMRHGHADENGKTSPESVAFFKLSSQHLKLLGELGLSPSSRARLSVSISGLNMSVDTLDSFWEDETEN